MRLPPVRWPLGAGRPCLCVGQESCTSGMAEPYSRWHAFSGWCMVVMVQATPGNMEKGRC